MKEIWKDIKSYDGYQVSTLGNVKSLERIIKCKGNGKRVIKERILKKYFTKGGYLFVALWKDGKKKNCFIHRVVAQAFVDNKYKKPCVNHKDGIKTNNYSYNLEWVTAKENTNHAIDNGLFNIKGERHGRSKLKKEQILEIRKLIKNNSQYDLAKVYNISQVQIGRIVNLKVWKHI